MTRFLLLALAFAGCSAPAAAQAADLRPARLLHRRRRAATGTLKVMARPACRSASTSIGRPDGKGGIDPRPDDPRRQQAAARPPLGASPDLADAR